MIIVLFKHYQEFLTIYIYNATCQWNKEFGNTKIQSNVIENLSKYMEMIWVIRALFVDSITRSMAIILNLSLIFISALIINIPKTGGVRLLLHHKLISFSSRLTSKKSYKKNTVSNPMYMSLKNKNFFFEVPSSFRTLNCFQCLLY